LPPKKVEATKGMVMTSAVDKRVLGIVAVMDGLQKVVAQAVDGGYGNVHMVLPIREGCAAFSDREVISYGHR
jgi:hypothetical protein